MHRQGAPVLVLVGLLLLAGCTTDVRSDPASELDATGELPPGVTEDGIANASKLLHAHFTALNRTGYTDSLTTQYTGPDYRVGGYGTITEKSTLTAAEGMYPFWYRGTSTWEFQNGTVERRKGERWSNRTMHATRSPTHPQANSTVYCRWNDPYASDYGTYLRYPFYGVLNSSDYTVASINTTGERTLTTLRAERDNFTAKVVADSKGRIHHLEMSATLTHEDGPTTTRMTEYELKEVGVRTLEPPEWVSIAIDRVPHPEKNTCSHLR